MSLGPSTLALGVIHDVRTALGFVARLLFFFFQHQRNEKGSAGSSPSPRSPGPPPRGPHRAVPRSFGAWNSWPVPGLAAVRELARGWVPASDSGAVALARVSEPVWVPGSGRAWAQVLAPESERAAAGAAPRPPPSSLPHS